jgi:hypothetical protein
VRGAGAEDARSRRGDQSILLDPPSKQRGGFWQVEPPGFGPAIGAASLGEGLTLYLYDHDVAANLGKPEELP